MGNSNIQQGMKGGGFEGVEEGKNNTKRRNSEAGNRTPVVRVTGGNTKPLYYFGPVLIFPKPPLTTTTHSACSPTQCLNDKRKPLSTTEIESNKKRNGNN